MRDLRETMGLQKILSKVIWDYYTDNMTLPELHNTVKTIKEEEKSRRKHP